MTIGEFAKTKSGTRATKVRSYTDSGQCIGVEYVPHNEEYEHNLEQAMAVGLGIYIERTEVERA